MKTSVIWPKRTLRTRIWAHMCTKEPRHWLIDIIYYFENHLSKISFKSLWGQWINLKNIEILPYISFEQAGEVVLFTYITMTSQLMGAMASQITSLAVVYSLNCLFGRRSKKTSKLRVTGFMRGIHRGPVNSPHKWPVAQKMFPFDDVIMSRNGCVR